MKPSMKSKRSVVKKAPIKLQTSTLAPGLERLERAMAHQGLASRREAKDLIVRGMVSVNSTVVFEPGFGIRLEKDVITIADGATDGKESMLIYKARGIETSKTSDKNQDIHDVFPRYRHLQPIGRLDKDSEGLIILSNDGTLAKAITGINSTVSKTYQIKTRENISESALRKMASGIMIDSVMTKPAETKRISPNSFTIVLHEGRKHQIRRMCDAVHLTIESLIRINIGHLKRGTMKPGSVLKLSPVDITKLKQ